MEMSLEEVELGSRVLEAAVRTSGQYGGIPPRFDVQFKLMHGMALSQLFAAVSQRELSQVELHAQPGHASRCCSLLVSVAKELQSRAALPGIGDSLLPHLCGVATASALPCDDLAEQLEDGRATPDSLPFLAGPASTAWLFAGGWMLVTVAQLLRQVPAWLARPASPPGRGNLVQLLTFVLWLQRTQVLLAAMKQQLGRAGAAVAGDAAATTSVAAVTAAEGSIDAFLQAHEALFDQTIGVALDQERGSSSRVQAQLPTAFEALSAACSPPHRLPAAVQAVGASLCAAFPQRFACNNPACGSTVGLSEAACAKKKCSACKVRSC
jgi:hypothetical protein